MHFLSFIFDNIHYMFRIGKLLIYELYEPIAFSEILLTAIF